MLESSLPLQTGTGKSFTMEGRDEPELRGIIPNTFNHIFEEIARRGSREYLVRASYLVSWRPQHG